jgi:hypothetical protein
VLAGELVPFTGFNLFPIASKSSVGSITDGIVFLLLEVSNGEKFKKIKVRSPLVRELVNS